MRYWLLLMVVALGVDAYAVATDRAGDATAISLIALAVALFAYFMVEIGTQHDQGGAR